MKSMVKALIVVGLLVPVAVFGQVEESVEVPEEVVETIALEEVTILERSEDLLVTLEETTIADDGIAGFILRWRVFRNAHDLYEAVEKYESLTEEQSGWLWEFRAEALKRRAESQVGLFAEKVTLLYEYGLISKEDTNILLDKARALLEQLEN